MSLPHRAHLRTGLLGLATLLAAGLAQAALVQTLVPSTTTSYDTQLLGSGVALIYDANAYSATEGRLRVVASAANLSGPGVSTSTVPQQNYLGGTDSVKDMAIELRINNSTGALISGTVLIPRDLNYPGGSGSTADSWTAAGTVTNFGWQDFVAGNTGNTFDVRWRVDSYDFTDVAANTTLINAPASCNLGAGNGLCGYGYARFGTTGIAWTSGTNGAPINFGIDWVRGTGVISGSTPSPLLGTLDDGINASSYLNNAASADIFVTPVPLPGAVGLMGAGLAALLPWLRRRRVRAAAA